MKSLIMFITLLSGTIAFSQDSNDCDATCLLRVQQQLVFRVNNDENFEKKYEGVLQDGKTPCSMEITSARGQFMRAKMDMGDTYKRFFLREAILFSGNALISTQTSADVFEWHAMKETNGLLSHVVFAHFDRASSRPLRLYRHDIPDQFNLFSREKVLTCTFK